MVAVLDANTPVFSSADSSSIKLKVQFDHIPGYVMFNARGDDSEQHGRDLFMRANRGDFGPVAPYVAPVETVSKKDKLTNAFKQALSKLPANEVDDILRKLNE